MEFLHLNEIEEALKTFTIDKTPCFVQQDLQGYSMLLDKNDLENCKGSVDNFVNLFE